jgi:cell fate regulator YaaT (PSP1 superfamily)
MASSDEKTPEVPPPGAATTPDEKSPETGAGSDAVPGAEAKAPGPGPEAVPPEAAPPDAAPPDYAAPPESVRPPIVVAPGQPTCVVRYGVMGLLGRFVHSLTEWRCGKKVVIKSERGQELGMLLCKWEGCGAPEGISPEIKGEVVRIATANDVVEAKHLLEDQRRELVFCKQRIVARGLPMKLVAAEHLFGGDRIVFYFLSETRVDFRTLVRDLAQEYRTRIEMRQIGVRDEARLLGDYERCGRPLCCRAWIKELQPVSMKMAKIQKATLDPTKISGRCGRLMCCLRFEDSTYRELVQNLPRKNTFILTPQGIARVVDGDVVTQIVSVQLADGKRVNVAVEDIQQRDLPPPAPSATAEGPGEGAPRREERSSSAGRSSDRSSRDRRDSRGTRSPGRPSDRGAGRPASPAAPAAAEVAESAAPAAPSEEAAAPSAPPASGEPAAAPGEPAQAPGEGGPQRKRRRRRRSRRGRGPGGPGPGGPGPGGQSPSPQGSSGPPSPPPASGA